MLQQKKGASQILMLLLKTVTLTYVYIKIMVGPISICQSCLDIFFFKKIIYL